MAMSKMAAPEVIVTPPRAVQAILYGPAPFFGYPWKPLLNTIYGGGYAKSYKHFRMQHMDGANLFYHCLCLVWQLSSNYALLGELDQLCRPIADALSLPDAENGARIVSRATSALWSIHLLSTSPTPAVVKIASVASIIVAHNFLGDAFDRLRSKIIFLQGFVEAIGVQKLIFQRPRAIGKESILYFLLRTALWQVVSQRENSLKEHSGKVTSALLVLISSVAASKNPLSVVLFGLFGWIASLLTGNKAVYYWSAGMMATISQGIAHNVAGEAGTLEVLQKDSFDQTSYELSHVTFFPNLLFQALQQQLKAASQ